MVTRVPSTLMNSGSQSTAPRSTVEEGGSDGEVLTGVSVVEGGDVTAASSASGPHAVSASKANAHARAGEDAPWCGRSAGRASFTTATSRCPRVDRPGQRACSGRCRVPIHATRAQAESRRMRLIRRRGPDRLARTHGASSWPHKQGARQQQARCRHVEERQPRRRRPVSGHLCTRRSPV